MKPLLSLLVTILLLVTAQLSFATGKYRLPYRHGDQWGLADENGAIVIPCKYLTIEYEYPFAIVTDPRDTTQIIFDLNGSAIDTGLLIDKLDSGSHLLYTIAHTGDVISRYRATDNEPNPYNQPLMFPHSTGWITFNYILSCHIINADRTRHVVPGIVIALADNRYALTANNNKCGIYDLYTMSYTIAPEFDSFVYIKPSFLLGYKGNKTGVYDVTGKQYPFTVPANAHFIDGHTGNYVTVEKLPPSARDGRPKTYRLTSPGGQILIPEQRVWEYLPEHSATPASIRLRKKADSMKYGEGVWQLADLNANIVCDNVEDITRIRGNVFKVTVRIDRQTISELSYDAEKGTLSKYEEGTNNATKNYRGFFEVNVNGTQYYSTDKGQLITPIADAARYAYESRYYLKLELTNQDAEEYNAGIYHKTYYAFRSDTNNHFIVYDGNYNFIDSSYEELRDHMQGEWIAARKNGKWGLLNYQFREVTKPVFDVAPRADEEYATGTVGGIKKKQNIATQRLVDINRFDEFGQSSFGNKYIAVSYKPKQSCNNYPNIIKAVFVTDSNGKILDSLSENDADESVFSYTFTTTGKIARFSQNSTRSQEIFIMPSLHGPRKKCPYPATAELLDKKICLLKCTNNNNQVALLSPDDMKVVIPFGKYGKFTISPSSFAPVSGNASRLEALLIQGSTSDQVESEDPFERMQAMMSKQLQGSQNKDEYTIGFYTATGKACWKN